jgi:hypothetical protein
VLSSALLSSREIQLFRQRLLLFPRIRRWAQSERGALIQLVAPCGLNQIYRPPAKEIERVRFLFWWFL